MSQQRFVIVGGGIAGLMIARMIHAHRDPGADIVIVERESHFGGQYSYVDYGPAGGRFDHGMHVYYDTCIPEVDLLFTSIWPDSEWNIYEQNWKDSAGIFFSDKLQTGTPWVDLRQWPEEKLRAAIADMPRIRRQPFQRMRQPRGDPPARHDHHQCDCSRIPHQAPARHAHPLDHGRQGPSDTDPAQQFLTPPHPRGHPQFIADFCYV